MPKNRGLAGTALGIPDLVWMPLVTGALMLIAGGMGYVFHQPWMFPSLGPTAFMQACRPNDRSSGLYSTLVGHSIGIAAGYLAVWIFAAHLPPLVHVSDYVTPPRMWAAAVSVGATMLGHTLLRCYHPPAAATTLIIALGVFQISWHDAGGLVMGILIVACCGELLRRLRRDGRVGE
ncbi:MAG: HPP family protein [Planctomycetaceae bacterium]|nr:HPP family protein [Planctomycetaceae bacterium]